jgi:hypothetical protein
LGFEEERNRMPYQEGYSELGEFIFEENPYGSGGNLLPGFQSVSQFDDEVRHWDFGGHQRQVQKAIRVPYRYRDKNGHVRTEHLLIGFEGSGGN